MTFFVMTSDSLVRFRNQAESVAPKILDSQFLLALGSESGVFGSAISGHNGVILCRAVKKGSPMSDSELHQIALSWVSQLAAAGGTYTQGSHLAAEWAEKLRQADMRLQENEAEVAKKFPKVTAYRKKHFQKLWEIVTAEKQHANAFGYVLDCTDELWDLESAVGARSERGVRCRRESAKFRIVSR